MKLTNVKALVAKSLTVGLLGGALVLAAPANADAQQFVVGVQVGYPHDAYNNRRAYDEHLRFEQERRREEAIRHEEWVRAHEHPHYRYGYGYYGRR